jgi:light-regulated signal transduction histidine kinase (bacteriophytochrome)
LCGKVQVEISIPAFWAWHDHSRASRPVHGAAYATYVGCWRSRFRVAKGERQLTRFKDEATGDTRAFCSRCGTPVVYTRGRSLVRNAAEALTDAGRYDGKVVVEAAREAADFVVIRVRDNVPGFDPDLAEGAVAPFATTKTDGLGLGLSLARSIVEAHGGRPSIESTTSGPVVSFTLPALAGQKHDRRPDP